VLRAKDQLSRDEADEAAELAWAFMDERPATASAAAPSPGFGVGLFVQLSLQQGQQQQRTTTTHFGLKLGASFEKELQKYGGEEGMRLYYEQKMRPLFGPTTSVYRVEKGSVIIRARCAEPAPIVRVAAARFIEAKQVPNIEGFTLSPPESVASQIEWISPSKLKDQAVSLLLQPTNPVAQSFPTSAAPISAAIATPTALHTKEQPAYKEYVSPWGNDDYVSPWG